MKSQPMLDSTVFFVLSPTPLMVEMQLKTILGDIEKVLLIK